MIWSTLFITMKGTEMPPGVCVYIFSNYVFKWYSLSKSTAYFCVLFLS